MSRFIAFYLPQYHPIPENDKWYGKGFTEWTNVAKARKLFIGHKQPHVPADLGFYDLRMQETREEQAQLAMRAGIEGFCYWDYWFGNGKRLLNRPFDEVVESGTPNFPFCLGWANHSWYKKLWNPSAKGKDILIAEQLYPGEEDYIAHFQVLLPAFKDKRYIKVEGKLLYIIHSIAEPEKIKDFMRVWRRLAAENGLNDFYFIARDFDSRYKERNLGLGFDAILNDDTLNIHHHLSLPMKGALMIGRKVFGIPTVFSYRKAARYMVMEDCRNENVMPVISPNWDHSPRSGRNAMVLHHSTPELFKSLARRTIDIVKDKPVEKQLIFIKSWNEWGEGNYMEPDLEFGTGYIDALREAIDECK